MRATAKMFLNNCWFDIFGGGLLKVKSHGILYYLCSADVSKSFSQLCQYLSFLNIFFR